uniref:RXLR-class effector Avh17 n=1 Tax=Phytophthora ramorum TaxID=164328 RepID=H3GPY3_PHYRM|nr:RXLR-class effector Avh17 [Phytophthora ramorum]
MCLSHIFVVIAATFLLASATPTDSNQAKIVQATLPEGLSQRLLRTYPTTYEDDDSEERGDFTKAEKALFKAMRGNGKTADDYAEELGIAAAMREVERTGRGVHKLQLTQAYGDYVKYYNYLRSNKNK